MFQVNPINKMNIYNSTVDNVQLTASPKRVSQNSFHWSSVVSSSASSSFNGRILPNLCFSNSTSNIYL